MRAIIAIDPGYQKSAYIIRNVFGKIYKKDILQNSVLAVWLTSFAETAQMVLERPVCRKWSGKEVSDTALWTGVFAGRFRGTVYMLDRNHVLWNIVGAKKANDSLVIENLIKRKMPDLWNRYEAGEISNAAMVRRSKEGFFEGFREDIWQAYALLQTFIDFEREKGEKIDEYRFDI